MTDISPIQQAVVRANGQTALARAIGCTQGLIWQYVNGSAIPPPERCIAIERATGVICELLRPDITWDRDDDGAVTGYRVPVAPHQGEQRQPTVEEVQQQWLSRGRSSTPDSVGPGASTGNPAEVEAEV